MATYFFETITAAQALGYTAATDTLVFSNATSSAAKSTVLFNAATATQAATVSLIDNVTGKSVVFGLGVLGEGGFGNGAVVFPNASHEGKESLCFRNKGVPRRPRPR